MRCAASGIFLVMLLGATALLAGCTTSQNDPTPPAATVGTLTIDVKNMVGADSLVLGSTSYTSPAGEQFTVSLFRYYLSNFRLRRADGSEYAVPNSYFLVRELRPTDPWTTTGKHIVLDSIPVGTYTGCSFLVGVDEARNHAGAQTGALDPANYMYWNWDQGYIFLQMEGNSPQSGDQNGHALSFHIGGLTRPNTLRVVAPAWPGGAQVQVGPGQAPRLRLHADVRRLFAGDSAATSVSISFADTWFASGGATAGDVATNYSGSSEREVVGTNSMFRVVAVQK